MQNHGMWVSVGWSKKRTSQAAPFTHSSQGRCWSIPIPAHVSDSFVQKKIQGWDHLVWSRFDQVGPCKSLRLRLDIGTTPDVILRITTITTTSWLSSPHLLLQLYLAIREVLASKGLGLQEILQQLLSGLKKFKWICLKRGWPKKTLFSGISPSTASFMVFPIFRLRSAIEST